MITINLVFYQSANIIISFWSTMNQWCRALQAEDKNTVQDSGGHL